MRKRNQPFGLEAGGQQSPGCAQGLPAAADAMAVTEIGQSFQPFIACAADAVVSVAMKAAAEPAA